MHKRLETSTATFAQCRLRRQVSILDRHPQPAQPQSTAAMGGNCTDSRTAPGHRSGVKKHEKHEKYANIQQK
jgi:hypothetical protein